MPTISQAALHRVRKEKRKNLSGSQLCFEAPDGRDLDLAFPLLPSPAFSLIRLCFGLGS